jgi:hypothetical protein
MRSAPSLASIIFLADGRGSRWPEGRASFRLGMSEARPKGRGDHASRGVLQKSAKDVSILDMSTTVLCVALFTLAWLTIGSVSAMMCATKVFCRFDEN